MKKLIDTSDSDKKVPPMSKMNTLTSPKNKFLESGEQTLPKVKSRLFDYLAKDKEDPQK